MANVNRTRFILSFAAGCCLSLATLAQAQTCSTVYNQFLHRYETQCSNGTSATQTYNSFLNRSETIIRQPGGMQQQCTQTYNTFLRRMETVCR